MTSAQPPRLAIALLGRIAADDALAGDLIEEFSLGRSRLWFWKQVLAAVLLRRRHLDIRPVRLFDTSSLPGLGLILLVAFLWRLILPASWLVSSAVLGGAAVAVALVVAGRRHKPSTNAVSLQLHHH